MAVLNMFKNELNCNGTQNCSGPHVLTWMVCKNILVDVSVKDGSIKGKLYKINYLSILFQSGKGKQVQEGTYPLFSNQENQFKSYDQDIWTNQSTHNEIVKLA